MRLPKVLSGGCGQAGFWEVAVLCFLFVATVLETIDVVIHFQDMDVMREPVAQCAGHSALATSGNRTDQANTGWKESAVHCILLFDYLPSSLFSWICSPAP